MNTEIKEQFTQAAVFFYYAKQMSGHVGDLSPNQAVALEQVSMVHVIHLKLQYCT